MNAARARVLFATLACIVAVGCQRSTPPTDGATSQASVASRLASASDAPIKLHNWVLEPPVAETERGASPLRLVCAAPSATEICCALGLRACIVGRTRFCDYPPGLEAVPEIGSLEEMNAEVLLSLRPDLLLVSGTSRAISEHLDQLHLRYEPLPDRTLSDVFIAIERVGRLTGRPETARALCAGLRGELQQIARHYAAVPPARVLVLLGTLADPPAAPFVAGPGSLHDDLLHLAGHKNVADSAARIYAPWSLEMILRSDPDVIIELDADGTGRPGGDAEALQAWSRLGPLHAVQSRRVFVLSGRQNLIPGPRISQCLYELCRVLAGPGHD